MSGRTAVQKDLIQLEEILPENGRRVVQKPWGNMESTMDITGY